MWPSFMELIVRIKIYQKSIKKMLELINQLLNFKQHKLKIK